MLSCTALFSGFFFFPLQIVHVPAQSEAKAVDLIEVEARFHLLQHILLLKARVCVACKNSEKSGNRDDFSV